MAEKNHPDLQHFLRNSEVQNEERQERAAATEVDGSEEELIGRHRVASISDSDGFRSLDMSKAPMSMFYQPGSMLEIRAASTGEIQDYSTVDENNFYDITMKLNAVLGKCSRLRNPDGTISSYRDIKEGDRHFLITEISRLTAATGKRLQHEVTCPNEACNHLNHIEVSSKNFVLQQPDEALVEKFFNEKTRTFDFTLKSSGEPFSLGAPTIGLAQDLYVHMVDKMSRKQKMNVAFYETIPWMLHDRSSISIKGADEREFRFTKMSREMFLAVNASIKRLKFGIEELMARCEKCGVEVRTPFTFPGGYSAIFIVPDAFEDLVG